MRYAIGLEYDGSEFFGWQIQRQEPTVQGCLEAALARVADQEIRAVCCGRTDTGVHALGQVAHFDSSAERAERDWVLGLNSHLPAGVSVLWIRQVDESFHARFSAFSRTYRYLVLNRWIRPALDARRMSWCRLPLDAEGMHEAAQALRGEHDFTSFRAGACQARHAVREIHDIAVRRSGEVVTLEVTANGFLYHMVRNIAGTLLRVGQGNAEVGWPAQVLALQDRSKAAPTAAPEGLYFVRARYPQQYGLPATAPAFPRGKDLS
jgi:tRNA pseudouridine38-40 synthase